LTKQEDNKKNLEYEDLKMNIITRCKCKSKTEQEIKSSRF